MTSVNAVGLKVQACQKRGVHGAPETSWMSGEASLSYCVGSNPIMDSTAVYTRAGTLLEAPNQSCQVSRLQSGIRDTDVCVI